MNLFNPLRGSQCINHHEWLNQRDSNTGSIDYYMVLE